MKKEMKEGTKEEKKKGKIPELYLDIQRRRTADERRVLAEAELCLLTHIEYQKAVAEWNRYVTEVTPWAALFQKLAGPLMIFAAAAREGQEQAARYAGQIQQAEERLRQILKTQLPGKQDASLPEVKRELETAEEFHLSQLTRPELSFEELEILEAESFIFAGKKRIFQKHIGAFEPEKKRPGKPSGFYGSGQADHSCSAEDGADEWRRSGERQDTGRTAP